MGKQEEEHVFNVSVRTVRWIQMAKNIRKRFNSLSTAELLHNFSSTPIFTGFYTFLVQLSIIAKGSPFSSSVRVACKWFLVSLFQPQGLNLLFEPSIQRYQMSNVQNQEGKEINYYLALGIFGGSILQFVIASIYCHIRYSKKFTEWRAQQEMDLRALDSSETGGIHNGESEYFPLGWYWVLPPLSGSIMLSLWTVIAVVLDISDEPVPYRLLLNITLQVLLMLFIIWTVFRVTEVLVPSQHRSIAQVLHIRKEKRKPLTKAERTLVPVFMRYLRFAIIFIFLLMIAQNLGLPIASILGGLGIAGVAVAFAASAVLQNLFGATVIVAEGLFHLGDWIKVGDVEGDVEQIGFRTTVVRQPNKTLTIIPNSTFLSTPVHNLQETKPWQIKFLIHLSTQTPVEKVEQFLESCHELFDQESQIRPNARIWIKEITPTSIVVRFVCYTAHLNPKDDRSKTDEWRPKAFYLRERLQLSVVKISQELRIQLADTTGLLLKEAIAKNEDRQQGKLQGYQL